MKNLKSIQSQASACGFDKRKINLLVKKAQKTGLAIYSACHEDGEQTFATGWKMSDYKNQESDICIFEITDLIQKKKSTRAFQKAATYTAKKALFIFCELKDLLDSDLADQFLENRKNKCFEYAKSDFFRTKEVFENQRKFDQQTGLEKEKFFALKKERSALTGIPGMRSQRSRLDSELSMLMQPTINNSLPWAFGEKGWMTICNSFEKLEDYQLHKWKQELIIINQ